MNCHLKLNGLLRVASSPVHYTSDNIWKTVQDRNIDTAEH